MDMEAERQRILQIIESYPQALANADAEAWEKLFWLDDPGFTEIENDKRWLLDRDYIEMISGILRKKIPGAPNQKWYDTQVHFLSPDAAYSVSLRDELNTDQTSRVTLIYLKKADEWRIIHGHFSNVPE